MKCSHFKRHFNICSQKFIAMLQTFHQIPIYIIGLWFQPIISSFSSKQWKLWSYHEHLNFLLLSWLHEDKEKHMYVYLKPYGCSDPLTKASLLIFPSHEFRKPSENLVLQILGKLALRCLKAYMHRRWTKWNSIHCHNLIHIQYQNQ